MYDGKEDSSVGGEVVYILYCELDVVARWAKDS